MTRCEKCGYPVQSSGTCMNGHSVWRRAPAEAERKEPRWGAHDDNAATHDEIAKAIGVTRQRAQQIEAIALAKVKRRLKRRGIEGWADWEHEDRSAGQGGRAEWWNLG